MTEGQSSILIVDDDKDDLSLVERALRPIGSEIFSIRDPHEVVPTVYHRRPDVVILDALLPGLSGFDLCKQIKTDPQLKGIQVLILTGVYLRQQYRNEAVQQFKADAFLTKPFRPPELQRLVAQLLSRRTRTPQSSFLKRIGLPVTSETRKRGLLGRLFGRGDSVEEPIQTRAASVSNEAKSESVPPEPQPEKEKAESRPAETLPQTPETPKPPASDKSLAEEERKTEKKQEEVAAAAPDDTPAREAEAEAEPEPKPAPLAPSSSTEPETPPDSEPEPEPAKQPEPEPAMATSTHETAAEPEAKPAEEAAPAVFATPPRAVEGSEEEPTPAPMEPVTTEPVSAETVSAETIAIANPPQGAFAGPLTVRLEGKREEPDEAPESPEVTISMLPDRGRQATEHVTADEEATKTPGESGEPAEVVNENASGNGSVPVVIRAETAPEPSAVEELEAPPPVESEKFSWMEAQSRTREMTVDEARSRAQGSGPVVEDAVLPEEPVPPSAPADAEAPKLTLENRRFLEALTSQDGPGAVKEAEPQPDRNEGAPLPVETAEGVDAAQTTEEVQVKRHPVRRPPSRVGDVPIYQEEDFFTELKRELSKCRRVDRPLTLIMIRVGDLSQIVELFGKKYREAVLWHVAEQATVSLREVDLVGMMSSNDRIAMTAFASDRYGGGRIVSRMRKAVEKNPFRVEGAIPPIIPVLDFGMATFPQDGDDVSCLMRKAEDEIGAPDRDERTTGVHPD